MKNYEKPTIYNVAVIPGHPNYLVYEDGRIFSIKSAKFLKPIENSDGHLKVILDGKQLFVHRLVAEAFIPNPNECNCIHHLNGIMTDNRVQNLIWIDRADHSRMHMRGNVNAAKPVIRVSDGAVFPSAVAASRAIGLNDLAVTNAINKGHRCAGSYWTFDFDDDPYDIFEDEPDYEGRNIFED